MENQQNNSQDWQNAQQQNTNPGWQNWQQQNANPNWQTGQQQYTNPGWQNRQQQYSTYQAANTPMGDPADVQANKAVAVLSYLGILFFLPLVACPNSKYGRFHANQALLLLLTSIGLNIVSRIIKTPINLLSLGFPFSFITGLITGAAGAITLVLMIIGMVSASRGEMKPLPVIGNIEIIK